MEDNSLTGGHYLEPYAGGAGVALQLLFDGKASHVHINDADPAVYAFWVAATKYPSELLALLDATPITIEEWFRWRSVLRNDGVTNIIEKGFATLFLNRTNRSGILKAGVIGGKEQAGDYKLDARFKKDVIASRIEAVAKRSSDISVYCEDSLQLLGRGASFLPKDSLIYLDPPYYVKGKGLYRNYYEHDDHAAIAKLLQRSTFKWPWVVSYDNAQEICSMYQVSQALSYGLNYTAQRRYVGSEVMFFSKKLSIPDQTIPHAKSAA
jgi:DNA adenine methylase